MAKHGLSRQAKKYREEETTVPGKKAEVRKPESRKPAPKPVAPPPQPAPEPPAPPVVQEPVAPPPPAPEPAAPKVKRPRFVFVRQKSEKKPETKPAVLPPRSTKLGAKLMSKNLALPPKEDATGRPKV